MLAKHLFVRSDICVHDGFGSAGYDIANASDKNHNDAYMCSSVKNPIRIHVLNGSIKQSLEVTFTT